ncbi:MAG TPA: hypothetical protein DCS21_12540 [Gammaproteobacteria bacterium]|nr:hypothetical protein [Gammaproteobacteria bacterium]
MRTALQPLLKCNASAFQDIFHSISINHRVVLAEDIPKPKAEALFNKLTSIGLNCRIDPMKLTLATLEEGPAQDERYYCPACYHGQPRATDGRLDTCERCGIVGRNYEETAYLRAAIDRERRRLQGLKDSEEDNDCDSREAQEAKRRALAQEKLLEQARRQAEKELGIRFYHKLRFLLKPEVLYPLLGSVAVGLVGVGLLVWQIWFQPKPEPLVTNARLVSQGVQVTITPPPGLSVNVAGASPQGAPASIQALEAAEAGGSAGSVAASNPDSTAAGSAGAGKTTTATATASGSSSGSSGAATPLLNIDKLAPPNSASVQAAGRDPQVFASLAQYQMQIGDLKAAARSIDQAVQLLSGERNNLSSSQLDAFNRMQVDVRAKIAQQHHQQRDSATAKEYWSRATNLTSLMTTPSERAQALSGLARTLYEAQPSTAKAHFKRAIEATRLITEPSSQALVWGAIARDLAQTGQKEQAQKLFDQATAAVRAMSNTGGRWEAQAQLAKQLAEAGDTVATKALLKEIASKAKGSDQLSPTLVQYQAEALSALALNLSSRGEIAIAQTDFAAALKQAQALPDPARRSGALLYLARDVAAAGDKVAAGKLAAAAGTWQ